MNWSNLQGFPGCSDGQEMRMAAHSSFLAWRITRTEEPGKLQSMSSQRMGHKWAPNTFSFTFWEIVEDRGRISGPTLASLALCMSAFLACILHWRLFFFFLQSPSKEVFPVICTDWLPKSINESSFLFRDPLIMEKLSLSVLMHLTLLCCLWWKIEHYDSWHHLLLIFLFIVLQ